MPKPDPRFLRQPDPSPIFNTHQNNPLIINMLRLFRNPSGTTPASFGVQTVSFCTPPGAVSMPSAS